MLAAGENPTNLQRENSILPEGFFKDAKIENLNEAIGGVPERRFEFGVGVFGWGGFGPVHCL